MCPCELKLFLFLPLTHFFYVYFFFPAFFKVFQGHYRFITETNNVIQWAPVHSNNTKREDLMGHG